MDNNNEIIQNNNLYDILGITKNANHDEIKKAYKLLVLKYHPDKNNDKDSHEEFIKVQTAYKILTDDNMKREYDNIKNDNKNNFKKALNNFYNNYKDLIDLFVRKYMKNVNKELDIEDVIECDLLDRYNNKYMLIEVSRKTRPNINLYVPLCNEINIFEGEGEKCNVNYGDLILHTKTRNTNGYYCKKSDMFKEIEIDKDDSIIYYHIKGEKIEINKEEIIDNKYIILNGLGLPISDDEDKRGDLICDIKYFDKK